ncbi:LAETG motif-containing sortase-dependent surface protein [Streptomyces sp. NPDC050560]|uniref:LAETG motif-containing sortase-dependent surface protein n=1 Tax=Streptomyces sp. NPDC050560 TaxID=3365630 RepID=UPI0037A2CDEF
MKLRRTLSAAAATAALTPLVLLTATAAHAVGGAASPSPSAPVSGPTADPSPSAPADSAPSGAPSKPGSGSPSASSSATDAPPCNNGPSSLVHFTLTGMPATIEAGGGWSTFTMTVADTSDTAVGDVEASVNVNNGSASENADLYLHSYLEYWDADGGKWLSLKDEGKDDYRETGIIYGYTSLKAHESTDLTFRLRIDSEATLGGGYAIGGGTYLAPGQDCTDGTTTQAVFKVVARGKGDGGSGDGSHTPGPTADGSGGAGSSGGGNLADTGSSSTLPVIGGIGAAVVVAGAGTMIVVRRRGGGSTAV